MSTSTLEDHLESTKVVVSSHEFGYGPPHTLEEYLAPRVRELLVIYLPMTYAPDRRPRLRLYRAGEVVIDRRFSLPGLFGRAPMVWVRDMVFLAYCFMRWGRGADLFVGVDPFNAAAGIVLRSLGFVRGKVVFYTIDFSPRRFKNGLINKAYHRIDLIAATHSNLVWNLSPHIHEGRLRRSGPNSWARTVVVPMGVNSLTAASQSSPLPRLVFLGHLLEKQGLQHAIAALPEIAAQRPDIELVVIGTGEYEEELRRLTGTCRVTDRVRFLGYVADHTDVDHILQQGGIGLAPYDCPSDSFTRFTDPGKIKNYLAAGLPILVTDAPPIARDVVTQGAGLLVEPNPYSLANGALRLLGDEALFARCSKIAVGMAKPFVWTDIFESAFTDAFQRDQK